MSNKIYKWIEHHACISISWCVALCTLALLFAQFWGILNLWRKCSVFMPNKYLHFASLTDVGDCQLKTLIIIVGDTVQSLFSLLIIKKKYTINSVPFHFYDESSVLSKTVKLYWGWIVGRRQHLTLQIMKCKLLFRKYIVFVRPHVFQNWPLHSVWFHSQSFFGKRMKSF